MKELITTSIKLEPKQAQWVMARGRKFNFSAWVRERIDEELKRKQDS